MVAVSPFSCALGKQAWPLVQSLTMAGLVLGDFFALAYPTLNAH